MTPVYSFLVISGWHGTSLTKVITVGETPKRFRIRAITRTKLHGRNKWLEPGQETLVPKSTVRHGEWSVPVTNENKKSDHEDILNLLENTSLNIICAFRMAAKDIRAGKIKSAVYRIKSDLDKVVGIEERKILDKFIKENG